MKIIEVIPISRGIGKETLSYFGSADYKIGMLISIPLRGKKMAALVVGIKNLSSHKAEIRAAAYRLRKAGPIISRNFFSAEFIESAREAADYFASSTGAILNEIVPKPIMDSGINFDNGAEIANQSQNGLPEKIVFEADDDERQTEWKTLTRNEFAKQHSIFFCFPSIVECERTFESLSVNLKDRSFIFHGNRSRKDLTRDWQALVEAKKPVAIFTTPIFIGLACKPDLKTIVIEHESSSGFKGLKRPFIDFRIFAEILAKKIRARLIFGDQFLRSETVERLTREEFREWRPMQKRRVKFRVPPQMIDMRPLPKKSDRSLPTLSDELLATCQRTIASKNQMFILAGRRGLAPQTICEDCGKAVLCERCAVPVILHEFSAETKFVCHKCGAVRSAKERCVFCDSWKLKPLGVGTARVVKDLKEKLPNATIFRFDSDTIKNYKTAIALANEYYQSAGAIMVGTEMALPYLWKPVSAAAVASIDALFSIPDFRIGDKIFSLLQKVALMSETPAIIQTRQSDHLILKYFKTGDSTGFRRVELDERKKFGFPPFKTLVMVSAAGRADAAKRLIEELSAQKLPKDSDFITYEGVRANKSGSPVYSGLFRLNPADWPNQQLLETLRSLPPNCKIVCDPDSIL